MVRKIITIFLLTFCLYSAGYGQDIHFSQFMNAPANLNPALTGHFQGTYRFIGNFRQQWRSVTIPYNTLGLAVDANQLGKGGHIGAGLSFFYDKAGDSRFSTVVLNAGLAYYLYLDKNNRNVLSFGVQTGVSHKKFDYLDLYFDNQYQQDGYNPDAYSGEDFSNTAITYPNLNAGMVYTYAIEKRKSITSGIAVYNITQPEQSFFGAEDIRLDLRVNLHASAHWKLSKKVDIMPQVTGMFQGKYKEINIGGWGKYIINEKWNNYRAVYGGLFTRTGDAAAVGVGMDYGPVFAGLTYDFNYSSLIPASGGRGGFEVSVIYTVPRFPDAAKYRKCPVFM